MSDNNDDGLGDLSAFLDAADADRPKLEQVIKDWAPDQFDRVVQIFDQEWQRRNQPRVEDMDAGQFAALVRRHMKD
jgi:hypothetical protein